VNRYRQYADPYREHVMSMDRRHAAMIRAFLLNVEYPANVIEVGSCYGVSTAEILYACEEREFPCTLIDTHFQESIAAMAREAAGRVQLVLDVGHSVGVLGDYLRPESIVVLDGDHRRAYMELESEVIERRGEPRAIVLHDVTTQRPDCDGPAWLLHHWQRKGYFVAIDFLPREGERTDRGLAILCREPRDAEVATGAMCADES
jgi:hypothetical protein